MSREYRIYIIENDLNKKKYVGITSQSVYQRWQEHVSRFNRRQRDHKLYLAMKKYGIENFTCYELCKIPEKFDPKEFEQLMIEQYDSYNNGYNMTRGGDDISDGTREKISAKLKGRKITWHDKLWASRRTNPNYRSAKEYVASGGKNVNAKSYVIKRPDGTEETIRGLRAYCRENGLRHSTLLNIGHQNGFVLVARFNDQSEKTYIQADGNGAQPVPVFELELGQAEDMV